MHWKFLGALLLGVAIFICGYQYAAALYGRDTAALAAAWEERDKALAESADLRSDAERVRREADAARRSSVQSRCRCLHN